MEDLDRWIAENVMGWEIRGNPYGGDTLWCFDGKETVAGKLQDWYPSTDIAQAMQVVGKVDDCLHLKQYGKDGTWCAMFCGLMTEWVSGDTPEMAICLAAKAAGQD